MLRRHGIRRAWPSAFAAAACGAAMLVAASAASAAAQATAKDLYLAAQAREKTIRAALDASPPEPPPTRDAMRQAVAAYRQVVLRYPASGYCDNALWQAAQLLADSFVRHGDDRDRSAAVQLLMSLQSEYPSSPLVPKARADIPRIRALGTSATADAADARPADTKAAEPNRTDARPADPPPGANAADVVLLSDVRRRSTATGGLLEIEFNGPVQYREQRLYNPARVFFDLAKTRTTEALKDATLSFESGPIRQVRIGRHPNETTRVVMDIADGARCSAKLAVAPYRLLIACGGDADALAGGQLPPASAPPAAGNRAAAAALPGDPAPVSATPAPPDEIRAVSDTPQPPADAPKKAAPATDEASAAAPTAPSANGRGGFSIARQLGLRVGRIVIDAGHGGRDPGAQGPGYTEAALTLDIALRLEKLLAKEPGVEIVLTRRSDDFIALQERTEIANREGADLFLSIHANASRNRSARGIESYLLNFASTEDAAAVAARENASSTLTMSHLNDLVKQIALNNKLDESRDLARQVQSAMVRKLKTSNQQVRDLGVKQAPFVVLVGASMPSVLVEVSFLTHKQEGRLLGTGAYRQRIAEALLDGIRRYLRTLKRATTDTADGPTEAAAGPRAGLQ